MINKPGNTVDASANLYLFTIWFPKATCIANNNNTVILAPRPEWPMRRLISFIKMPLWLGSHVGTSIYTLECQIKTKENPKILANIWLVLKSCSTANVLSYFKLPKYKKFIAHWPKHITVFLFKELFFYVSRIAKIIFFNASRR